MGHIRHHAIVVTAGDYNNAIDKAHAKASELGFAVTPIVRSLINGYQTFCICPDGSKEGWQESENGNDARDAFIAYCGTTLYEDGSGPLAWVEVQYGDDNLETKIARDSDMERREP